MTANNPTPAPGDDSREAAIRLLPCPFCGAVPDIDNPLTFQSDQGTKWGHVVCCCQGPEVRTGYESIEKWRDDAITAWNTRAAPQANESTAAGGLDRVLADVREERGRQEAKWGPQNHPFPLWLTILSEEVGEASREFLHAAHEDREHGDEHATKLRKELVQAAAVAVQIIEVGDRKQWWPDHRGTTPETP